LSIAVGDLATLAKKTLTEGAHTIVMSATDTFNQVKSGVQVKFTIDTTAPGQPSTPVLVLANGSTAGGGTVSGLVTVRSIADTGSIVRLYRDGAEVAAGVSQSPV